VRIALLDYGAGNLTSVRKALAAVGATVVTPAAPSMLVEADGVIVPGVGHFQATAALAAGWRDAVLDLAEHGRPVLGICLGMQWLFEGSAEAPHLKGLGLFRGLCRRLGAEEGARAVGGTAGPLKVPHVGWNTLDLNRPSSVLLEGLPNGTYVYFTHSYAAPVTDAATATTTYGGTFAAVAERDWIFGVQFHPEKSAAAGLRILANFVAVTRLFNG
jgi:glutamine amidotransferase